MAMAAKAVLTCRPNSHPFQERTLILDQPAKIGRSVARARPNGNNAIFDCKVLSRNHALLWHENGKFFLQDTKSSNGTFINNQRLSKSSEESAPREVCSGDIVQFGVDVMEVNKKLTHGCIVANLQLFLPDGKEAKASSSTTLPDKASNTPLQDVYLLNGFVKEGMQKEQMIEHKLAAITKLLLATKESMHGSWKAMIEEDRLLTRIDILERQLETSHKCMTDEKLIEQVTQLHEDKEKYQTIAKEALWKSMQEKMDVLKKCHELEKNVQNFLKEKELYKQLSDKRNEELQDLADKYEKSEEKSKELEEEITAQAIKYKDELDELNKKLKEEEDLLIEKQKVLDALISKMDAKVVRSILAAHNDNTKVILAENDSNKLNEEQDELLAIEETNSLNLESDSSDLKERFLSAEEELTGYKHRITESSGDCGKLARECEDIESVNDDFDQSKMSMTDDKLREQVTKLHQDKEKYQTIAKEALRKSMQEKMEVLKKCHDLEKNVQSFLKEKELYKQLSDKRNEELQDLSDKYEKSEEKSKELKEEITAQAIKYKDELDELNKKLKEEEDLLLTKQKVLDALISKVDAKVVRSILAAHNDNTKVILAEINSNKFIEEQDEVTKNSNLSFESDSSDLKERLLSTEEELAVYKHRFSESSAECAKLVRECQELRSEHDTLFDQSKMVQLRYIIPIVILILAILIGFHPSS